MTWRARQVLGQPGTGPRGPEERKEHACHSMTVKEMLHEDAELARYGADQARHLGITLQDIPRIIAASGSATGLRVVLDTNVYVSAFTFPRGVPRQVWRQALHLLISN